MNPLLEDILRHVDRRYRLPALADSPAHMQAADPSAKLAVAIEHARESLARHEPPGQTLKQRFIDALEQLIRDALRTEAGDPAFQAMVLRHSATVVREHASLSAHARQDERGIRGIVNAIAHPARLRPMPAGPRREALDRLHATAAAGSWSALSQAAERLRAAMDRDKALETASTPALAASLARLLDSPALGRLRRLEALRADKLVQRYQTLWEKQGPRAGSSQAAMAGSASRRRGSAVETSAMRALQALAARLNKAEGAGTRGAADNYRVVASMRVPASIPASHRHAKTEWDAVLLKLAGSSGAGADAAWDICLLAEAKASVDAASTDLPRLLRGLRLLARAEAGGSYSFRTQEGTIALRGASLSALATDETSLKRTVLYCCDAPAAATLRPLSAASRMQLLSAPASLEFAAALEARRHADPRLLDGVWRELLESPRWAAVLQQYPTQRLARDLMVNTADLLAAVEFT